MGNDEQAHKNFP